MSLTTMDDDEEFITLNLSGNQFKINKKSINMNPCSFFESLFEYRKNPKNPDVILPTGVMYMNDEFFVQRSPQLFHIVLQNCLTGKLHIPPSMCKDLIMNEIQFWRLDLKNLCQCCRSEWDFTDPIEEENSELKRNIPRTTMLERIKYKLWGVLENEDNSKMAFIFGWVSLFFIGLSTANLIVSSIPDLQFCPTNGTDNVIFKDSCSGNETFLLNETCELQQLYESESLLSPCRGTRIFTIIDTICVVWFTLELILRGFASPNLLKFVTSPMNIIDAMATLPYYLEVILWAVAADTTRLQNITRILVFLRVLRTFRVLRVLKLARYVEELRILGGTIVSARSELTMLIVFVIISVLIFGSLIYDLEKDSDNTFYTSIPAACWWSIVTLTTVGYGDVTPKTLGGKIVGAIACVTGILVIALPVTVLVEHFNEVYKHTKNRRAVIEARHKVKHQEKRLKRAASRLNINAKKEPKKFVSYYFGFIMNLMKSFVRRIQRKAAIRSNGTSFSLDKLGI